MQLQDSLKQLYKTVKKYDMRNFCLFTENKPNFLKANNDHNKQKPAFCILSEKI